MGSGSKDIKLRENVLKLSGRICVMGILNVTPDSFSDGARYLDPDLASDRGLEMQEQGADIIDIGGESSRPGALPVTEKEELDRVMPVLKKIKKKCRIPVSIDTCKSEVAKRALTEGAEIINDITALRADPLMAGVIAEGKGAVCLMHMKGTPRDMQTDPHYRDILQEITNYLRSSIRLAEDSGIDPNMIIVDPGIGFGKKIEHNLEILKKLSCFNVLTRPIMVGVSRKSFIGEITGKNSADRISGTAAAVCAAILNGADIIRVHDVREMRDVALVSAAIKDVE